MDAEGARALARRIAQQQAKEQQEEREARRASILPVPPDEPPWQTVVLTSVEEPSLPREQPPATEPGIENVDIPKRRAGESRDIRMYSRRTETATVNGSHAVVTTLTCRAHDDGGRRSRV